MAIVVSTACISVKSQALAGSWEWPSTCRFAGQLYIAIFVAAARLTHLSPSAVSEFATLALAFVVCFALSAIVEVLTHRLGLDAVGSDVLPSHS